MLAGTRSLDDRLDVTARRGANSSWRGMTHHTELVPVGISKVRAIVVLVVLGPQPRRPFRCAAVGKSDTERLVYGCSTLREERDHVPVARLRRELIMGLPHQEEGSRAWRGLPSSPRSASFTEARLDSE